MTLLHGLSAPRSRRLAWPARILALVLTLAIAPIPGGAGELDETPGHVPPWLRPQASIRLTLLRNTDNRPLIGEFREGRGDSIWIRSRYTQRDVSLPLAEVLRFEVSQEESRRTWSGAGIGFLGGALLGVAAGASEGSQMGDTGARIAVDAVLLGCLGMIVGAVVGHSVKADHWTVIWNRGGVTP
jgi:hypothetical protein